MSAELPYAYEVEIEHLLVSPIHRYEGRPSDGPLALPDAAPDESRDSVEIRARLGIRGDRFFARPAHRAAAVTIFSAEALDDLADLLGTGPLDALATRRNIIVRGADVDRLVGARFSLQSIPGDEHRGGVPADEIHFDGHRPAHPCAWMNVVLAPGAHKGLRGRGGVRTTPTSDGVLHRGSAILRTGVPAAPRARSTATSLF